MDELYHKVPKQLVPELCLKIVQGNMMQFMLYANLLYWPLTTIGAARLATPFIALVIAYLFLGEYSSLKQFVCLLITLAGASLIIQNAG